MSEDLRKKRERLLKAAEKGVDELINILESPIGSLDGDLAADKMKNAAAAKRLAFEDALFILDRIDSERSKFQDTAIKIIDTGNGGFAEGRAKSSGKK